VEILLTITVVAILLTAMVMLIMVFKKEGLLAGIICFVIFPLTYYFAIYDFKRYSIPFVIHIFGFVVYWIAV